jgi:two-component system, NtrC family, response regulator GlrR
MQRSVILLLCPDPEDSLSSNLRQVLAAGPQSNVGPLRGAKIVCQPVGHGLNLPETVKGADPSLILLVLPSRLSRRPSEIFRAIRALTGVPVVIVYATKDPDEVFELMQTGADDFITTPLESVHVLPRICRLLETPSERREFKDSLKQEVGFKRLIGESSIFLSQVEKIAVLARCDVNVLILGETGTGKDLFARSIHYMSPRSSGPFIPINCGAIPVELIENELFGHERGAYTGADKFHKGLFSEADGGTLFLDEIDSLPLVVQVKLLRFLQEKEYRALGSTKTRMADVRIILATNADLEAAVKLGKIREDFYYRISVVSLTLPPLRKRQEDIPLLARYFLAKYSAQYNKKISGISAEALQALMFYDWPGNVRQLEHVVEAAVVLCAEAILQADHIVLPQQKVESFKLSFREMKARVINDFEKHYIGALLQAHHGNISRAALAAKKDRRTFFQLIRKHKIDPQNFRMASSSEVKSV